MCRLVAAAVFLETFFEKTGHLKKHLPLPPRGLCPFRLAMPRDGLCWWGRPLCSHKGSVKRIFSPRFFLLETSDPGTGNDGISKAMTSLLVFPCCQDRAKGGIPFEEAAVLECFSQVCDAVCFVHQLKMVHRDIKSRNVFLCRTSDGGFGFWVAQECVFCYFPVHVFVVFFSVCFSVFFFLVVLPQKKCTCLSHLFLRKGGSKIPKPPFW